MSIIGREIKDRDLVKVETALLKAAQQARVTAYITGTPLIIYENGQIIYHTVSDAEFKKALNSIQAEA